MLTRACVDLHCSLFSVVWQSTVHLKIVPVKTQGLHLWYGDSLNQKNTKESILKTILFLVSFRALPDFTVDSPQFSGRSKNSSRPLRLMVVCRSRHWPTELLEVGHDRAVTGDFCLVNARQICIEFEGISWIK